MTNFTKEEIDIIREMMFVGSVTAGIDIYLEGVEGKKEVEANKILFKLGFGGINKDGSADDIDKDGNYILEEMDF
tara:strand:- start:253 stop:477 length:225 start_codon:yes stop_codon:yes gene_type:complete